MHWWFLRASPQQRRQNSIWSQLASRVAVCMSLRWSLRPGWIYCSCSRDCGTLQTLSGRASYRLDQHLLQRDQLLQPGLEGGSTAMMLWQLILNIFIQKHPASTIWTGSSSSWSLLSSLVWLVPWSGPPVLLFSSCPYTLNAFMKLEPLSVVVHATFARMLCSVCVLFRAPASTAKVWDPSNWQHARAAEHRFIVRGSNQWAVTPRNPAVCCCGDELYLGHCSLQIFLHVLCSFDHSVFHGTTADEEMYKFFEAWLFHDTQRLQALDDKGDDGIIQALLWHFLGFPEFNLWWGKIKHKLQYWLYLLVNSK